MHLKYWISELKADSTISNTEVKTRMFDLQICDQFREEVLIKFAEAIFWH